MAWYINEEGDVYVYSDENQIDQATAFPNDFHTAYETQDEAEIVAAHLGEHPVAPLPQMSYEEAISYAIFAINTLEEPSASSDADVERLYEYADQVKATLVDIRETVQSMGPVEAEIRRRLDEEPPEPKWPAVTPT